MAEAIVLFSGGQDSTTVLAQAIANHGHRNVIALSAYYGQRHAVELRQASDIASNLFDVQHELTDVSVLGKQFRSDLTKASGSFDKPHPDLAEVPSSFVPMRNATLITVAFGVALREKAHHIYAGMCQTDYSGYPDCRADFIVALNTALNVGYGGDVQIHTPLMFLSKASTFALAEQLGVLDIVIDYTHTCYEGDHTSHHEWGYGCGQCPACVLRAKGWNEFSIARGTL